MNKALAVIAVLIGVAAFSLAWQNINLRRENFSLRSDLLDRETIIVAREAELAALSVRSANARR